MTERIKKLTELTLNGNMYVTPIKTDFDKKDLLLEKTQMEVKRICEYILNQEPKITEFSAMTGFFLFDGSVVGDAFKRGGHRATQEILMNNFYLKPIDNVVTQEWQHATADYKKILEKGISGIISDIDESMRINTKPEEIDFLVGLKKVAETLIKWSEKCSEKVLAFSKTVTNAEYKENLKTLSKSLLNVPKNKPASFYEAILSIYICFSADPDSVGTLDRYLTPFYKNDIANGKITREQAKEYLQELFLMLQAATNIK